MPRKQRVKIESDGDDDDDDDDVVVVMGDMKPEPELTSSSNVAVLSSSAALAADNAVSEAGNDEEEDVVVQEIPVFLSPGLSDKIQLVQFPLQQRDSLQSTTTPEAVRVKPRHCMMEMDVPTPSNIEFNGLYHMPSRTFLSKTIPVTTHMALGKMMEVENEDGTKTMGFHLVPLSRMTQMRPSFSHIDEAHEAATATTEDDLRRQAQDSQNAANERKSITFRKKESERQELARKSSYGYKMASEESEGWHSLEVYDEDSEQAKLVMEQVACPKKYQYNNLLDIEKITELQQSTYNKQIPGTSLNVAYLNTLNYLPHREDFGEIQSMGINLGKSDSDNPNNSELAKLAMVVTKLVKLMRLGMPIPFSLLRNEFPEEISDSTLCVALGNCAVLVRGNWCLNSKLLSYPKAMTQARTLLMCLFQSMRVVYRERLLNVFDLEISNPESAISEQEPDHTENRNESDNKVTPEVIAMLLEQLGEKTKEGWVLKVADNLKFAEQHPQTTLVHLQYWAKQIELFAPMIDKYREDIVYE